MSGKEKNMFGVFTEEEELLRGEDAPDSEVSVIKVVTEVLGNVKSGTDVSNIPLPASVLDPVSSLEKSKKSMQRGELLPRIPKMETPEERFLGVIRWILSGLPKEKFGKKVMKVGLRGPFPFRDVVSILHQLLSDAYEMVSLMHDPSSFSTHNFVSSQKALQSDPRRNVPMLLQAQRSRKWSKLPRL
mmetsp:Transcript_40495/g.160670  ORF Transcript_40495/g.160670 Transcript_40495/m.160670 type:complete len:187 (-) Transcript_40495:2452-3012(-)